MALEQSRGATGRGSAIGRAIEDERAARAAEQLVKAKQSAKKWGFGCLFFGLLFAFFVIYSAGYVAASATIRCKEYLAAVSTPAV